MRIWKLALLGLLALLIKAIVAAVPQIGWLADPLLVVAVFSALGGRRWVALTTGLVTGLLEDVMFGGWLGLHAFTQMSIAFVLAIVASKVDMTQAFPAMLAMAVAAFADWGIQIGLAALFNRSADVIPGTWIWLAAVGVNMLLGLLFYRLVARRGSLN